MKSRHTLSGTDGRASRLPSLTVVFVAFAGWASGFCSGEPPEGAPPASEALAAPAVAAVDPGKLLFEVNCATCHGAEGRGDGPMASSLPTQPANIREHFGDHSFEEMARRVTEGIPPTMPPAPIPPEEVRQALSYVWSLIPVSEQARLRALQELAAEEH